MKAVLVFLILIANADAVDKRSLDVEGVIERLHVRYLPDWRYTGVEGERGDVEMTLDFFTPKGDGPFPLVIYVHGGGYGGGSKKIGGENKQFVTRLLEEGVAVASLDYILKPKGIFPQAWWDYRDAVRFLRKNASEYKIDALRFGAYGLSAGGWLLSSATAGNGDLVRKTNGSAMTTQELKAQGWKTRTKGENEPDSWLRPMRDPSPSWPGIYGGVSAISFDFDHYMEHVQPHNPIYQKWAGVGYTPPYFDAMVANGAKENLVFARLANPRFKGQKVHVPPFYSKEPIDSERNKAMAWVDEDALYPLGEVVLQFFTKHLVSECRLPAPEIYPVPRIVAERTEVSMVAPTGATIHYTVDGTEPTPKSPRYAKPFSISGDAVVKAFAVRDGLQSSGVNVAHFVAGPGVPTITSDETLPPGKTGEPYKFVFESDSEDARWLLQGELFPHVPWKKQNLTYPNNMVLDSRSGVWSGTPYKPGKFWIQIWVNNGAGTLASHRDYIWEVTGDEKPGLSWEARATDSDTNVEVARLVYKDGWKGLSKEMVKMFRMRGVKALLVGEGEEDRMLLAEQADAADVRACVDEMMARFKKLAEKTVFP